MKSTLVIIDPIVKKSDALGVVKNNASQLARILNISRQFVCSWGEDIPPLYAYRLLRVFPHLEKPGK